MIDEVLHGEKLSELSFLEILDHTLNRGLVIAGEITISVADIDLVFVGVNLLLGSVETIHSVLDERDGSRSLGLKTEARTGGQR